MFTVLAVRETGFGDENEFPCFVLEGDWVGMLERSRPRDRDGSDDKELWYFESSHVLEIVLDAGGR
jgi:hypothetical protein